MPRQLGVAPHVQVNACMSTYTYEIVSTEEGWLARCLELGVEALGGTRGSAVARLRRALSDKLSGSDAVAPPPAAAIDFDLVERVQPASEPYGPGDSPAGSLQ